MTDEPTDDEIVDQAVERMRRQQELGDWFDRGRGIRCSRHPDRHGDIAIVSHYLDSVNWRDMVKADQVFGALCHECRREFIAWIGTEVEVQS